jgi:hypothetical protein
MLSNKRNRTALRSAELAIDFHLTGRRAAARDDPRGRTWLGWDPYASDERLWEVNRGDWALSSAPLRERFATLSYDGRVRVAAEITGREPCGAKWALKGDVLRPGDPIYNALVKMPVDRSRNTVRYVQAPEADNMTTAERAAPSCDVSGHG